MSYATPQDMEGRFPAARLAEITDPTAGAVIDQAALQRALDDASLEMDAYLGQRYELPLALPQAVPVWVCCDIALYRLMALLPKEVISDARRRYEDALEWLKDVASGDQSLAPGAGVPAGGGSSFAVEAEPRVFTRDSLKSFRGR